MFDFTAHHILIIDDEPDNLEVFRAALEMLHGSKVTSTSSGDEALAMLATARPTLIVTDLSMPKMDGYALLHLMRARSETADLPIIAVTAHAMKGDRERILEAGFDGYISKPFDISTLGDELESWLNAFKEKKNAPATAAPEPDPVAESKPDVSPTASPEPVIETIIANGASHAA